MPRPLTAPLLRIADAVRAGDWWDYKFGPLLLLFYASAVRADASIASLWLHLIELLGAVTVSAVFVSVLNDWTDRADDRAAGKRNRLDGRERNLAKAALILSIVFGAGFVWLWRDDAGLLCCFAGTWVAFALYSVPPVRLKTRGAWGVVADAAGSNLSPGLLATGLTWTATRMPQPIEWSLAAGCWIFAFGLRGIIWHQLIDEQADHDSKTNTFVQAHGRRTAIVTATWVVLPIELATLGTLLWQLKLAMPIVALLGYVTLLFGRRRIFNARMTLIAPKPSAILVMQEYYDTILPVMLLVWSCIGHRADVLVLAIHLLLFWRRPFWIVRDSATIASRIWCRAITATRSASSG